MIRVESAELEIVAGRPDQFPSGSQPEVAFAGRSNVGKSSLINRLVGRRKLAHTSSTPGRTRTLNFYRLNGAFRFVDLPGYGYAKVSKDVQESWWELVEKYLCERPQLRGVVHLVDSRHPPTPLDSELREFLSDLGLASVLVLTKADKLNSKERATAHAGLSGLGVLPSDVRFFSATTGEGTGPLWQAIEALLRRPPLPRSAPPADLRTRSHRPESR